MGMKITDPARNIIADEAALLGWFDTAPPGEHVAYHIGHLASDRAPESSRLTATARDALDRVADRVMALVGRDLLIVVQRRLESGQMAYLAIKLSTRSPRPRALSMRQSLEPRSPMPGHGFSVRNSDRVVPTQRLPGAAGDVAVVEA
jgi:hypothetical protein